MSLLSGGEMDNKNELMDWNLYVLRYNYSGNYYVGTTEDFERRMLDHWRKTSDKKELPIWSQKNKSIMGFKFYWFKMNKSGITQGEAEHCENQLANRIVRIINSERLSKKCHIGNGKYVDRKIFVRKFIVGVPLDAKIDKYLKKIKRLKTKDGVFSIECCRIGYVGEYHQCLCNKKWKEVSLVEFSSDD